MSDDIVKVRDCRRPGHFWADNELIDIHGKTIGIDGLAVYMALSRVARNDSGECEITLRQISSMIGCSPQTAMRAIVKLEKSNLVVTESKGSVATRQPSVYVLLEIPKRSVPIGNRENNDSGTMSVPSSVPIGNTYNTVNTKEDLNTSPSQEGFSLVSTEPKVLKSSKVDSKNNCDPRYKAVTAKIFEAYNHHNKCNPPWGAAEGKQLKNFLSAHPEWTEEKIFDCIRNRSRSEVNLAAEPLSWISWLGNFSGGPLDKFGNPKTSGNGSLSRTNGSGTTGHLLDHLPDVEEIKRRRLADDVRLEQRRAAKA